MFSLAPAAPEVTEVRVRYAQSTGDLTSITATWNRMVSLISPFCGYNLC